MRGGDEYINRTRGGAFARTCFARVAPTSLHKNVVVAGDSSTKILLLYGVEHPRPRTQVRCAPSVKTGKHENNGCPFVKRLRILSQLLNTFKSREQLASRFVAEVGIVPPSRPPRNNSSTPFNTGVSNLPYYLNTETMRQQQLAWVVPALVLLQRSYGIWAFLSPCSSSFPRIPKADGCCSSSACFEGSKHTRRGVWRLRSKCSVRTKACTRLSASR